MVSSSFFAKVDTPAATLLLTVFLASGLFSDDHKVRNTCPWTCLKILWISGDGLVLLYTCFQTSDSVENLVTQLPSHEHLT